MVAKKQKQRGAYHSAIQAKTKKKISRDAAQTKQREKELLKEYRSLRRNNAFIDRRNASDTATAPSSNKRTRAEKFILEDSDTFGIGDTLGLTSSDQLQNFQNGTSGKSRKVEQLVKFKQARAEHVMQVQEDKELFHRLNEEFRSLKNGEAMKKMASKVNAPPSAFDEEDVKFNQYLTSFSLPSMPEAVPKAKSDDTTKSPLPEEES